MKDPTLKHKIERFKAILGDFDKLEKSVQAQLMAVADKMAPMVQGAKIAPKTMTIPEPKEYPDIKEEAVHPAAVRKHAFDKYAAVLFKDEWTPNVSIAKTQKDPSTTVPYQEPPGHPDYIKAPDNLSPHMMALRDTKKHELEKFADAFKKAEWKPELMKASADGAMPKTSSFHPASKNPSEVQPPKAKQTMKILA